MGSGELMVSAALADPITTRTVRVRDGVVASTDGPYAEAKEYLVGYYMVDCAGLDRATEIAARRSRTRDGSVSRSDRRWTSPAWRCEAPMGAPPTSGRRCGRWRLRSSGRWCATTASFDACEDAVQDALLEASVAWSENGVPQSPRGWLISVASRRLTDRWRSDTARRRREATVAALEPTESRQALRTPSTRRRRHVDAAVLVLPPRLDEQLAGRADSARRRRAHHSGDRPGVLRPRVDHGPTDQPRQGADHRGRGPVPHARDERPQRLGAVLQVLYLVFNEGYVATSGPDPHRVELTSEAIRLTREVRRLLPEDGEVAGLLALMLLTDARRPARARPDGSLVPLAEQDRSTWNQNLIAEGAALITTTLASTQVGPFQIQAAIAALHAEATQAQDTDWPQILALYNLLAQSSTESSGAAQPRRRPRDGPRSASRSRTARRAPHRSTHLGAPPLHAVRGHLLEQAGDRARPKPRSRRPPAWRPASPRSATSKPRPSGSPPTDTPRTECA